MSVVTFYSFKGGVGRTQAVANVAAELCRRGRRVVLVDLDLESPGIHAYFGRKDAGADAPGFLDYVDAWRTANQPPDLDAHLVEVMSGPGSVRVLGPGRLDGAYAGRLAALSWERFYADEHGDLVMERLRKELVDRADFVLIDSRTGMTDIGTICTFQLPDVVVAMFALHGQGVEGTTRVARALAGRMAEVEGARLKRVVLVPARVDEADGVKVTEWLGTARTAFQDLPGSIGLLQGRDDETFRVPYDRDVAYGEHIVMEKAREGKLASAYRFLADVVEGGPNEDQVLRWAAESERLAQEGRLAEALRLAERVVAARRQRAEDPVELAWSLRIQGSLLDEAGRQPEAVLVLAEAADLVRTLVSGGREEVRPALGMLLADLSLLHLGLGRLDEMLAGYQEAVPHLRASAGQPMGELRLAYGLSNLSAALGQWERTEEALAASQEAVAIFRRHAADSGSRHGLANGLGNLGNCLAQLDRGDEALAATAEAVEIFQVLAEERPGRSHVNLARALDDLSLRLARAGRWEAAIARSEQSLALLRAEKPASGQVASSLANLSCHLTEIGRKEDALVAIRDAVAIARLEAERAPEAGLQLLTRCLTNLAWRLLDVESAAAALEAAKEAIAVLRPSYLGQPVAHADAMTGAVDAYVDACEALDRPPDDELLAGLPRPPN